MKNYLLLGLALVCLPVSQIKADTLLRLKERVPLEKLAEEVLDPASPRFGKFYSPEEIREISGPDERAYGALLRDLKYRGYTVIAEDKTKLFLTVHEPKKIANALSTLALLNSDLIENIIVSDHSQKFHPMFNILSAAAPQKATTPTQIRALYEFNPIYTSGVSGKGQHIAIATYDGFNIDDINIYYDKTNLNPKPKVDQVIFNGAPALNSESAVETEVDAEFSGQLAPGAEIHVFASSENSDLGEVQIFNAILDDNRSKIVNYSWGSCEVQTTPQHKTDMDKIFARAIAQGVNIFVASGDSGALGCGDGKIMADWPAAHPNVIAVGGTKININVANDLPNETAWNGSGGGISDFYALPTWQAHIGAQFVRRSFPDVAFNADPQSGQTAWVQYHQKETDPYVPMWLTIGGTSIASPQWAGFLALVNEARGTKGSMSFINPILYSISAQDRGVLFNDVVTGDNNGYSAGPGWDAVTGWGSMRAAPLLNYLVAH